MSDLMAWAELVNNRIKETAQTLERLATMRQDPETNTIRAAMETRLGEFRKLEGLLLEIAISSVLSCSSIKETIK